MRIHTNTLTYSDIWNAAKTAGVVLEQADVKGSRSRSLAYEIALSGESSYKSQRMDRHGYPFNAASWDQWGIFLESLFRSDPTVKVTPWYSDWNNFRQATGGRFDTLTKGETHSRHKWESIHTVTGWISRCECGAVIGYDVEEN